MGKKLKKCEEKWTKEKGKRGGGGGGGEGGEEEQGTAR